MQAARARGWTIDGVAPFFGDPVAAHVADGSTDSFRPFADPIVGVRDLTVMTPHVRLYVSEPVNYEMPRYGTVSNTALFPATQFTSISMVVPDDSAQTLDFYDKVLGLWRRADTEVGASVLSKMLWGGPDGERRRSLDYDMQASGRALHERLGGVLKVTHFKSSTLPDYREKSRPGNLGLSLFTARVQPIEAMRERMRGAGATNVTPVLRDEFGQRAYSCRAPDGYDWTFIEAPPPNPYMHGGMGPRK